MAARRSLDSRERDVRGRKELGGDRGAAFDTVGAKRGGDRKAGQRQTHPVDQTARCEMREDRIEAGVGDPECFRQATVVGPKVTAGEVEEGHEDGESELGVGHVLSIPDY